MRRRACVGLALAVSLALAPGRAAPAVDASDLRVVARDGTQRIFTVADVAAMPSVMRQVAFQGEHGQTTGNFGGPLLWTLLDRAGAIPSDVRSHVRMIVTTTGSDGYTAVLALGEIDPAFEAKEVMLATEQDGKPVSGTGLRLIVPGDKRGGRSVRDVVRIAVGG